MISSEKCCLTKSSLILMRLWHFFIGTFQFTWFSSMSSVLKCIYLGCGDVLQTVQFKMVICMFCLQAELESFSHKVYYLLTLNNILSCSIFLHTI